MIRSRLALLFHHQMLRVSCIWDMHLITLCKIFKFVGAECKVTIRFGCRDQIMQGLLRRLKLKKCSVTNKGYRAMILVVKNSLSMFGSGNINMAVRLQTNCAVLVHLVIGSVNVLRWMKDALRQYVKFLFPYMKKV